MKRRTSRNIGHGGVSLWKAAALTAMLIIASAAVVSIAVYDRVISWETAAFLMKAAAAVACGLTVLRSAGKAGECWRGLVSVLTCTVTMLLIFESAFGGQEIWNPLPGIAASSFGCAAGVIWAIRKKPLKTKKRIG